jgi:hypothetical protein
MAIYEWGKGSPAQQERRVSDLERNFIEKKTAVEAAYAQAKAGLDIRGAEIAEMRAQLDRYYQAAAAKKAERAADDETPQRQLPARLDFIVKSIRSEMAAAGVAWNGFSESDCVALVSLIEDLDLEESVEAVLAFVDQGGEIVVDRDAVVADVLFCENAIAAAKERGGHAVKHALAEIEKHFEIFDTADPVYGLPEETWRAIVAEWAAEFRIPDIVVRPFAAGAFRGAKAGLALSVSRIREIYIDPKTGFEISPDAILGRRLREAAGIDVRRKIDPTIDPLDAFLKPARMALKRAIGTEHEAAQRRLLQEMEEVAPFVLVPGAGHAAMRARDHYPGRFFGEMKKVEIPWSEEDRKMFGVLRQLGGKYTFGNVDFDEDGMARLRNFVASVVSGEVEP